jgi:hypothetical protein
VDRGVSPPVVCVPLGRAEVVLGDGVSLFPPQATKAAITASAGKTIEACLISHRSYCEFLESNPTSAPPWMAVLFATIIAQVLWRVKSFEAVLLRVRNDDLSTREAFILVRVVVTEGLAAGLSRSAGLVTREDSWAWLWQMQAGRWFGGGFSEWIYYGVLYRISSGECPRGWGGAEAWPSPQHSRSVRSS